MVLARPALGRLEPPFGAVVARQLSAWPFAARTQRLFILVDPSLADSALRQGLLRAMQQAYFRSDNVSQTRSVREAALAAHYVLRHHNRDVLPLDQVCAAGAVAALRGDLAYVALVGDAMAFAWHDHQLAGQRDVTRVARPLGMDQEPRVTLWSASLGPGDRLVLACGAGWSTQAQSEMERILSGAPPADDAEQQLAELLGDTRPAGVLVVDPAWPLRADRRLVVASSAQRHTGGGPGRATASTARTLTATSDPRRAAQTHWLSPITALAMLIAAIAAAFNPHIAPSGSGDLVGEPAPRHSAVERIAVVNPAMAVRLGPSGGHVVDLAAGDNALYTLDVVEQSVRVFRLDARDQQPTPDTLLARSGATVRGSPRPLAPPVAMHYLTGSAQERGQLTIVDQARTVVQVGADRSLSARPLPSSMSWRELGALGGAANHLFVVDSGTRSLLEYPLKNQRLMDAPRALLDEESAAGLPFEQAAEVVGDGDFVYLRLDDGTVRRFDKHSGELGFSVSASDGRRPVLAGMALDRGGGLYLLDPTNACVLHTTAEGTVVSQLRNPALGGVRQIQSSLDGRRLFGLVATGVLVFDVPDASSQ